MLKLDIKPPLHIHLVMYSCDEVQIKLNLKYEQKKNNFRLEILNSNIYI